MQIKLKSKKTAREAMAVRSSMWIKVKEKKPPANKLVLLHTTAGTIRLGLLFYEARTPFWSVDGWKHNEAVRLGFFTHWHELPKPPKEE